MSPGMKKDTYGMKEFFDPIWKEMFRVLKPGGHYICDVEPRSDVQTIMSQTLQETSDLILVLHQSIGLTQVDFQKQ